MAELIGYMKCGIGSCTDTAEVKKAGGKRASLYTVCPSCGTNQGNGVRRQNEITESLKASREEINVPKDNSIVGYKSDTEEKADIPSKTKASSISDDTERKPNPIPKDTATAPPVLLGVLALVATLIMAFFATRKPKGQTA